MNQALHPTHDSGEDDDHDTDNLEDEDEDDMWPGDEEDPPLAAAV